jgi:hypothetical protein
MSKLTKENLTEVAALLEKACKLLQDDEHGSDADGYFIQENIDRALGDTREVLEGIDYMRRAMG